MNETVAATDDEVRRCRNCQTVLQGDYCHHCGQHEARRELRFGHLATDLAGDVFNWDSRLWRTLLPLLVRPGFLTAEFIAGRRARYVPPLRLYLIISFITFLTLSWGSGTTVQIHDVAGADDTAHAAAEPSTTGDSEKASQLVNITVDPNDPTTPPWLVRLDQRIKANAERLNNNPELFFQRAMDYLPQLMFLLLPLFALLLHLCYALSPFYYLQHLVFALHYHSFAYLLFLADSALEALDVAIGGWLGVFTLLYLPLALRRAYASGIPAALFKSVLLLAAYSVLLALAFAALVLTVVALL
ncbi:DUF3667 domain-containing protein [Parahaliea aestuarii]|uniref:DUF3667 domain-containing protein n=1 Tax=Parahaliea aestuarii TaxID=1852021 RepID=A0A5C9A0U5_9GAMM|nr:DUF3667 domain-containing protein [Parahaliea aestuarii]TXS94378.1 DUF3667 domain-containing protein [Parahaliea aestuarii]